MNIFWSCNRIVVVESGRRNISDKLAIWFSSLSSCLSSKTNFGFKFRKSQMQRFWQQGSEISAAATRKTVRSISTVLLFFIFSFATVAFYTFYLNYSVEVTIGSSSSFPVFILTTKQPPKGQDQFKASLPDKKQIHYSLNCTSINKTQTRPKNVPLIDQDYPTPSSSCPDYFHWIHEDLQPWRKTGITKEILESARTTAHFRLVILSGKVYVEKYKRAFQTRDVFTVWGILQLLKMYPGKVPDLDLIFDCNDKPAISSRNYKETGPNATAPPPLFRYSGSAETLDIPFPDWSFWGWPEVNIKPWESLLKELNEGNKKVEWMDREPYAYWKGNPAVSWKRKDLLKCNVSEKQDWNARLYAQDWITEKRKGFGQSNLADQCTYRYKIYIEGSGWSVSEKYILACDSLTLLVKPQYYDTFTRSLMPLKHYWPIKENGKCKSIKFAVEWGNKQEKKVREIGKAANSFINENMTMQYVYDYMFRLLNEYAKLLRFKPDKPKKAVEYCSETMACRTVGLQRKFMMETMVQSPSDTAPCILPPVNPHTKSSFIEMKEEILQQVETWENEYYENQSKHL